ncbi:SDR family oxidoreductase [Mycolicibacterium sp. 018/SC-01/001]|uniref:SDR family oxidoreductase n=1 Tax=Mycolicibacterium sp. 018/SC-01/001 TaxID=2592069 RepID=UPI0011803862|nr:SDR family oxidoreductase [Mycolicibacterium sp. 018/SC-01/001]TRW86265.1 SDR family oxidoreductase [Mycolicibacterium sp. 018/SC-01/001]
MKIVVVGGTGRIGASVVGLLTERGHDVIAAAPSTGVDTYTGAGLKDVLVDADVVVDVSNSPNLDDSAIEFFRVATRNLLAAEVGAGVGYHVALSVVGTDRLAPQSGYFEGKLEQERMIAAGSIPYTIVRATQFFEFVAMLADSATVDGEVRLPPAHFQPMAAGDVAIGVADAATGAPANGVIEISGPVAVSLPELIGVALTARGDNRRVVADSAARYWGVELEDRTLCPGAGARTFDTRFEDWILQSAITH